MLHYWVLLEVSCICMHLDALHVTNFPIHTGKWQEVKFVFRNKVHYMLMKQLPAIAGVGSAHLYASPCRLTSGMDLPRIKLTKEISTDFHLWVKDILKTDCGLWWGNRQNGPISFSNNYFFKQVPYVGMENQMTSHLDQQIGLWRTIYTVLCHVKWIWHFSCKPPWFSSVLWS